MTFQRIREWVMLFVPPPAWRLPVALLIAVGLGLGMAILHVSRATSYLSDDPTACINCHIMIPQYATWSHGAHGRVTVCNDCHVPHDNVFRKYWFKANDGLRHSWKFTFRLEPPVIRAIEESRVVIQENCIRCHGPMVRRVYLENPAYEQVTDAHTRRCWECHRETPHGRVNSLAAAPFARAPGLSPVLPAWIETFFRQKADR